MKISPNIYVVVNAEQKFDLPASAVGYTCDARRPVMRGTFNRNQQAESRVLTKIANVECFLYFRAETVKARKPFG